MLVYKPYKVVWMKTICKVRILETKRLAPTLAANKVDVTARYALPASNLPPRHAWIV